MIGKKARLRGLRVNHLCILGTLQLDTFGFINNLVDDFTFLKIAYGYIIVGKSLIKIIDLIYKST